MKKSVAAVGIAVVALGLIGVLIFTARDDEKTDVIESSTSDTSVQQATDQSEGSVESENISVDIKNFAFNPEKITVKKGTTVTWTNQDSVRHDVVPDNETLEFKASELLAKGENYSVTFMTPGEYSYFCSPHPYMKATVEVVE